MKGLNKRVVVGVMVALLAFTLLEMPLCQICAAKTIAVNADSMEEKMTGYYETDKVNTGEYLIKSDSETGLSKAEKYCESIGGDMKKVSAGLTENNILVADLSGDEVSYLNKLDDVTVEKNKIMEASQSDLGNAIDEVVQDGWNRKAIGTDGAKAGNAKVKIAVLDSGMEYACNVNGVNFVSGENNVYGRDTTGHGIAVSSVVSNVIDNCENHDNFSIYSLKVLDHNNQTPVSRVIDAIHWCIDNDIDVINMSFGMNTSSEILHQTIVQAYNAGIIMVGAAGNTGEEKGNVQYPAAYKEVIAVGAADEKGAIASFSASDETKLDVMAPGVNIPVSQGFGDMAVANGTSFAAPHTTVLAAILKSSFPNKSLKNIYAAICGDTMLEGKTTTGLLNLSVSVSVLRRADEQEINDCLEDVEVRYDYEFPELLQASWSGTAHKTILTENSIDNAYLLAYTAVADKLWPGNTGDDDPDKVLHAAANTNYVAATRYLFHAASVIMEEQWHSKTICDSTQKYLSDKAKTEFDKYTKDIGNGKVVLQDNDIRSLHKAIVYAASHDKDRKKLAVGDTTYSYRYIAYQVIGLALHIPEDAYAHKTIVKSLSSLSLDDFNEAKLRAEFDKNTLTTSKLKKYKNPKSETDINTKYTDRIGYMTDRYKVASKWAAKRILDLFRKNKEMDAYVFCPEYGDYPYKLLELTQNLKSVYCGYYKLKNNLGGTVVDQWIWQQLSSEFESYNMYK